MDNKYNQAFNSLVLMLSGGLRKEYLENETIKNDLETIKELVDKDTPKKPEKIQMIGITNMGLCPECNNSVSEDVGHQYSYCQRCGQKIWWWENECL